MNAVALSSSSPGVVAQKPADEIERWLTSYLRKTVGLEMTSGFDVMQSFSSLGLDSLEAEMLLTELETWLGRRLDSNRITRCGTIKALLDYIMHGTADVEPSEVGLDNRGPELHPFERYVNPAIGERIRLLHFDKRYVRGEGCRLIDAQGREYLDFLACYGAVPFGHNPAGIWRAIQQVRESGEPTFIQPSAPDAAGELGRRLLAVAPPGLRYVTFANSGAEAIEVAIKLCRAATRRLGILTTSNSFHGKTLAALSATGNDKYQEGFGAPIEHFHAVPYGSCDALRAIFTMMPGYFAAFIVEPIQGEGGIVMPPAGYLAEARQLCKERGVAFVLDEVQTGLGRTGDMFACMAENVTPDVMVLAKALGGGLVPIGACLCTEALYTTRFGLKHSSTFAANSLGCRVGIATLDLLERNNQALIRAVRENGEFLRTRLLELQARYPHVIAEIRGRGFLLGIRFHEQLQQPLGYVLNVAVDQGLYSALFSGYLLNVHGIRIAPTLNGADVVRIEPPLTATRAECEQALDAIAQTVEVFAKEDAGAIIRAILHGPSGVVPAIDRRTSVVEKKPPEGASRLAFVVHPLEPSQYREFDPSLVDLSNSDISELNATLGNMLMPFVAEEAIIRSPSGAVAHCEFVLVPRTAADLLALSEEDALAEIGEAVELGRSRGARLVGLGAYSSVVVRGGHGVEHLGVPITTGNSYTVVAGHEAIEMALKRRGNRSWEDMTAMILGAGGAIGRGIAMLMSERISRLCLVGNPKRSEQHTRERLARVAVDICRHIGRRIADNQEFMPRSFAHRCQAMNLPPPNAPLDAFLRCVEQLERAGALVITRFRDSVLPFADIVVTATSSPEVLIRADDPLKPECIICDLSRPSNIDPAVTKAHPNVLVINGGHIEIPGDIDLSRLGLAPGHAYACMAEAMLLALEGTKEHYSLGSDLPMEGILHLQKLAKKHGFRVAFPSQGKRAS